MRAVCRLLWTALGECRDAEIEMIVRFCVQVLMRRQRRGCLRKARSRRVPGLDCRRTRAL